MVRRASAWLAVGLLAQPAVTRDATAQELRRLPLYDVAAERPALQVAVWEASSAGDYPLVDLRRHLATMPPEVASALRYLDAVHRGRLDRLPTLYGAEADLAAARQAAQLYRRFLKGLPGDAESVRPQRTWHFGPYRVVVLRLLSAQGTSRIITVSLETTTEGLRRSDDWGTWQPVHELLWYLAGTLDEPTGSPAVEDLGFSLALGLDGADPTLQVELDGVHHVATDEDARRGPNAVREFVHHALAVAEGGADQAFLDLWAGEDRQWFTEALTSNRPIFNGARAALRGLGPVRDRFTLPLGEFALHYFTTEAEPETLRSVQVRLRADGAYGLSDRLPHNLQTLLESPLFGQALRQQVLGQQSLGSGG